MSFRAKIWRKNKEHIKFCKSISTSTINISHISVSNLVFSHQLKHIRSFIEIDRGKEQLVGIHLRVSKWIGYYRKLIIGLSETMNCCISIYFLQQYSVLEYQYLQALPAYLTLPLRCHGSKHNYDRVIPRSSFDVLFKFRSIEFQHRSLHSHFHQLLHTLRQGGALIL